MDKEREVICHEVKDWITRWNERRSLEIHKEAAQATPQDQGDGGTWREMKEALPSTSPEAQQKPCQQTREEAFGDLAKGESPLVQPPRYRGETFEIPHAMDTPIGNEV